jgi:ion channel-forming bestrophin family protein
MIESTEMRSGPSDRRVFWRHVWALSGSVSLRVLPRVLFFTAWAMIVAIEQPLVGHTGLEVGPVELAGGALVLLMVLRTNAGYDRWWEGRKLWGGIVNQSRNFAISTLAYTPSSDRSFRDRVTRWAAVFPHIAKRSLRNERDLPEVAALIGEDATDRIAKAEHMPSAVAMTMASLLREAVDVHGLPPFAFLQCDKERATLIDHIGACERILNAPLPLVYAIKLRRFVALYLMILPFALVERVGWLSPFLVALVAYPVLGIDQIAVELENPFSKDNMSHLPLDTICNAIEGNVRAMAEAPFEPDQPHT